MAAEKTDVAMQIVDLMRKAKRPLTSIEIARALHTAQTYLDSWDVRGVLKNQTTLFMIDKVGELEASTTWKLHSTAAVLLARDGAVRFQIDGFGLLYLEEKTSDADIEATLAFIAGRLEAGAKKIHVLDSPAGERVAKLASKEGFAVLTDF